ncbi:hypothetical protein MLD38_013725 [Melastoma candidum]|uniref:Uncharacterized protein n=1 Tax=Melastoma candidum TaxID=119954 RepID=A0ACB9RAH0_9MYRT|nr:hypothetical protein MLD38_013725 [Melastoma candidum]
MDSYNYPNYPDSGNSSPRSRDVDPSDPSAFFDDASAPSNYKLKFMVSYGGKIQPRPHDNHLTYVGGETKLLTVDRHLSLAALLSRLCSLSVDFPAPVSSFKYQLPGEDLDSLISVSSEDDLLHLFLEYDRLLRSSPTSKPPRMRIFLFPSSSSSSAQQPPTQSFIDALNSAPAAPQDTPKADPRGGGGGGPNSVDFLLGFEKGVAGAAFRQDQIRSEQVVAGDRGLDPAEVQRQLQLELQRMQLRSEAQDSVLYGRKVEEALNASGGMAGYGVPSDFYVPKIAEKPVPQALPPQQAMTAPAATVPGYWQEKQVPSMGFPATSVQEQPMYVIPGHPAGGIYHPSHPQAQMVRQVGSGSSGGGYYAIPQRFPPEVYREHHQLQSQQQPQLLPQHQQQQAMYGILPQQAISIGQTTAVASQTQFQKVASGEGAGLMRTSGTGAGVMDAMNYGQVMYAAAGGGGGMAVTSPYQGMVAVSGGDMRLGSGGGGGSGSSSSSLSQQEGKVMSKVTQNSL